MTEKRYFQREFEELYYIIDSTVISEEEFDERVEYEGYSAFEDSLTGEEIVELLNENEQLKCLIDDYQSRAETDKETINDLHEEFENIRKENEELKQRKEHIVKLLNKKATELYKENKQLKQSQDELYDFRLVYNALLFNEWGKTGDVEVYKSRKHHDGTIPFDDSDWFIVVAILPTGKQVTNHYHIDYWDYFKIKEYDKVKDEFDGHTSIDVLDRLKEELKGDVE